MAFTEFYCENGGDNLNAGSNAGAATKTITSGTWVQATRVFTKAGEDLSGVSVGMFASVFADGAAAPTGFIGRITAVDDGADTITIHATASIGTAPTDGTLTRTIIIGGAWKGPNAAVGFPFGTIANTLVNTSGDLPFVNLKNDATYSVTAAVSHATGNDIGFGGYTTTVRDGGKFILDAGGANIAILNIGGSRCQLWDAIIATNGTGTAAGLTVGGINQLYRRVVVHDVRGAGFNVGFDNCVFDECETYTCNQANTAGIAGFRIGAVHGIIFNYCIAHDNSGSNNNGWCSNGTVTGEGGWTMNNCIAETNGLHGVLLQHRQCNLVVNNCDFYNNGTDGIRLTATSAAGSLIVRNSNFCKQGGIGINKTDVFFTPAVIVNCGFGAGTYANTGGNVATGLGEVEGSVNYASNTSPWVGETTGDFRINLAAAKGAGRGAFTQTQASYTGAIGYPDIGSNQHLELGAGVLVGNQRRNSTLSRR